jgi:myosin heavy subunit
MKRFRGAKMLRLKRKLHLRATNSPTEYNNKVKELQTMTADRDSQKRALADKTTEYNNQVTAYNNKVKELQTMTADRDSQKRALADKTTEYNNQVTAYNNKVKELQTMTADRDSQKRALADKTTAYNNQVTAYNNKVKELQTMTADRDSQKRALADKTTAYNNQVTAYNNKVKELQTMTADRDSQKRALADKTTEYNNKVKELQTMTADRDNQKKALADADTALTKQVVANSITTSHLNSIKNTNTAAMNRLISTLKKFPVTFVISYYDAASAVKRASFSITQLKAIFGTCSLQSMLSGSLPFAYVLRAVASAARNKHFSVTASGTSAPNCVRYIVVTQNNKDTVDSAVAEWAHNALQTFLAYATFAYIA